jgi:hypothetical protein
MSWHPWQSKKKDSGIPPMPDPTTPKEEHLGDAFLFSDYLTFERMTTLDPDHALLTPYESYRLSQVIEYGIPSKLTLAWLGVRLSDDQRGASSE